jgi:hypothetical protein
MLVVDLDSVALDGDTLFSFQVHIIKHLVHHVPVADGIGDLQQPVCQCTLAMVYMCNDAKIPDILHSMISLSEGQSYGKDFAPHAVSPFLCTS